VGVFFLNTVQWLVILAVAAKLIPNKPNASCGLTHTIHRSHFSQIIYAGQLTADDKNRTNATSRKPFHRSVTYTALDIDRFDDDRRIYMQYNF